MTKSTKTDEPVSAAVKLGGKRYNAELARLQGELVAMQEWVKATGAKSSATFRTCPRRARWSSSIAVGTTGPVSSG